MIYLTAKIKLIKRLFNWVLLSTLFLFTPLIINANSIDERPGFMASPSEQFELYENMVLRQKEAFGAPSARSLKKQNKVWRPKKAKRIRSFQFANYSVAVESIELDDNELLNGRGTMPLAFLGKTVEVGFKNVSISRKGELLDGYVYLLEDESINELRDQNGYLNLHDEKIGLAYLELAQDETLLPISLSATLKSKQKKSFDNNSLLVTDLVITPLGMIVNYGLMAPSNLGGYYVFAQEEVLTKKPSKTCNLSLNFIEASDPPRQNYEFPLQIVAQSSLDASKLSLANFDCGGLKNFTLQGEYPFPTNKVLPTEASASNTMAYFEVTTDEIEQFMVPCTVTGFKIPGAEAFAFTPQSAFLDYSDTQNPSNFPSDHPRQVDKTWKGIQLGAIMKLPKGFKKSDGSDLEILIDNFVYDHGDGMSGRKNEKGLLSLDRSRINGWPISMDNFDFEVKYSSLVKLDIEGELRMPITDEQRGFPYALRLGDPNINLNNSDGLVGLFKLTDKSVFEKPYNIPYFDNTSAVFQTSSTVKLISVGDAVEPQADLNGAMALEISLLSVPLTFEHWKINDKGITGLSTAGLVTGGLDQMSLGPVKFEVGPKWLRDAIKTAQRFGDKLKDFDFPGPKLKLFETTLEGPYFISGEVEGELLLSTKFGVKTEVTLGTKGLKAGGEIELVGNIDFAALNTTNYWEVLQYKQMLSGVFWIDCDLSIAAIKGGLRLFDEDPIWGDGFKGALNIFLKKGLPGNFLGMFQFGKIAGNDRYTYLFGDIIITSNGGTVDISGDKPPKLSKTKSLAAKFSKANPHAQLKALQKSAQTASEVSKKSGRFKPKQSFAIIPGFLAVYGGGLGIFYNMERDQTFDFAADGRILTDQVVDVSKPLQLLTPGLTLSGQKFKPKKGGVGIKFTAVVGSHPTPEFYNGDYTFLFTLDYKDLSLGEITLSNVTYVLADLQNRSDAQAWGQGASSLNWREKAIYSTNNGYLNIHVPKDIASATERITFGELPRKVVGSSLIYGDSDPSTKYLAGSLGFFFKFNSLSHYYYYIGTAKKPLAVATPLFGNNGKPSIKLYAYLMAGRLEKMGAAQVNPRPLSLIHPEFADFKDTGFSRNDREILSGTGFVMGAGFELYPKPMHAGIFALSFPTGAVGGFDIGLLSARCSNGANIGIAGKYARGRVYLHLSAEGSVDFFNAIPYGSALAGKVESAFNSLTNSGIHALNYLLGKDFKEVKIKVENISFSFAGAEVTMAASGRLPNPIAINGELKGKAWIGSKGINKSFSKDFSYETGTPCPDYQDNKIYGTLDNIGAMKDKLKQKLQDKIDAIAAGLGDLADWVKKKAKELADALAKKAEDAANAIVDTASDALDTVSGWFSTDIRHSQLDIRLAKILLLDMDMIGSTFPKNGQSYVLDQQYLEVYFEQSMFAPSMFNDSLQSNLDLVELFDEKGIPVEFDLQAIRDTINRPGSREGFDVLRIYPAGSTVREVNSLRLVLHTSWMEKIAGEWEFATLESGEDVTHVHEVSFPIEGKVTMVTQADFASMTPAMNERYHYANELPRLVLENGGKLDYIGANAMLRLVRLSDEQAFEQLIPSIDPNKPEFGFTSLSEPMAKDEFYRLELVQEDGTVIFENAFHTSKYSSFDEKMSAAELSYSGLDVGDRIDKLYGNGEVFSYYISSDVIDGNNEVRLQLSVDEGFSINEITEYIPSITTDTESGYFKAMKDYYAAQFSPFTALPEGVEFYSDELGRTLSGQECQEWFTYSDENQTTYLISEGAEQSALTQAEIDELQILQTPQPITYECDAYKRAQFRNSLLASFVNLRALKSDFFTSNTSDQAKVQLRATTRQITDCTYSGDCAGTLGIPWYTQAPLKFKFGNGHRLEVKLPTSLEAERPVRD